MRANEMFINSLTIPDDEWACINIAMNENESDIFEQKAFDKTFFEVESSTPIRQDAFNIELDRLDADFFENEMDIDDADEYFTCGSTSTNSTIKTSHSRMTLDSSSFDDCISDTTEMNALTMMNTDDSIQSVQLSLQLPSLTSSELALVLEQSASRLNTSMKKSEMTRQKILQNGIALYETLFFSSLDGKRSTHGAAARMMVQSRKALESYASQSGSKTI